MLHSLEDFKKMAISRRRAQQDVIPFATAREEAMEFIYRGKDKPGCSEKDVDSIIGKENLVKR